MTTETTIKSPVVPLSPPKLEDIQGAAASTDLPCDGAVKSCNMAENSAWCDMCGKARASKIGHPQALTKTNKTKHNERNRTQSRNV